MRLTLLIKSCFTTKVVKKRYLFIDAFNVIHAVGDLRRALHKSLDNARDKLTERVASIHDAEGIHTVLIFDSRSDALEIEHPFDKKTFECIYAPSKLTADGVIERLLTRVPKSARTTVASNDSMVRESARVNGAVAISADDLYSWVLACERRLVRDVERHRMLNSEEWNNGIELKLVGESW